MRNHCGLMCTMLAGTGGVLIAAFRITSPAPWWVGLIGYGLVILAASVGAWVDIQLRQRS